MPSRHDPATGNQIFSQGTLTAYNVTPGTPLQIGPAQGRVVRVSVIASGSTIGGLYDASGVAATGVGSQIAPVASGFPATNPIMVDWPFYNGLTVVPGSGSVLAVCYQLERPGPN